VRGVLADPGDAGTTPGDAELIADPFAGLAPTGSLPGVEGCAYLASAVGDDELAFGDSRISPVQIASRAADPRATGMRGPPGRPAIDPARVFDRAVNRLAATR
jgi:hypothetical protein